MSEFASASLTVGQLNAIVKRLGGYEGAMKFLQGKLEVSEVASEWREEDGVIYFSVTSDGTTGEDWIKRLERKGFRPSDYTKEVLHKSDFKPTNGVKTEIAVIRGCQFEDNNRIIKKIRAEAEKRMLSKPNAEIACLIREKFTNRAIEGMGLIEIVVMHEPINIFIADTRLISVSRHDGGSWLKARLGGSGGRQVSDCGYAFAVS
jgi:hypothetical protein